MTRPFRVAFYIGNYPIYWYALTMTLAIIVAFALSMYRAWRRKLPLVAIEIAFFLLVPVGFIGARLGFILPHINEYHSFAEAIDIRNGGLSIQGATLTPVIVGCFYFLYWKKKYNINLLSWCDIIVPNLLIAQAIGRWGNFFNQEILGPVVTGGFKDFLHAILPNFIYSHLHLPSDPSGVVRQPFFLYESLANCLGFFVIIYVLPRLHRNIPPGTQIFSYLIWYGIVRASMELYRDKQDILYWGPIPTSFAAAIIYIFIGFVGYSYLLYLFKVKKHRYLYWTRPRYFQLWAVVHLNEPKSAYANFIGVDEFKEKYLLKKDSPIFTAKYIAAKKAVKTVKATKSQPQKK